ncbi:MAG: ATP synthase F1 subunit epsilon [Sphingomonadaceae bacterium]
MPLPFTLVTPERLVRRQDVYMVVVPGSEGDMGILAGHAPVMTTIRDGDVKIYLSDKGEPETLSIKGGFAEMSETGLTILAESVA